MRFPGTCLCEAKQRSDSLPCADWASVRGNSRPRTPTREAMLPSFDTSGTYLEVTLECHSQEGTEQNKSSILAVPHSKPSRQSPWTTSEGSPSLPYFSTHWAISKPLCQHCYVTTLLQAATLGLPLGKSPQLSVLENGAKEELRR